ENAGTLNGAGIYEVGENVTVMATAKDGFKFVAWYQNDVAISSSNKFSFNMPNRDVALIAEYEPIFTINYVSSDVNFGQVIGNTTGKYKENVTLEAISANNCSFIGWVIDDVVVSTATKLNITLNGDVEVRALFKKNFDWNIIIVLAGCLLFAVVLIAASSAYIKMKEAEPMPVRALINGKDDKDVLFKNYKRNAERDEIEPVPTRKSAKPNIQPIPVRKIVVAPSNHKGEEVKKQPKASEQKPTLSTDVNEE
ncbi:MAG: InlB B-repeat-containing protein, partial [Clostridia bacterium]|nr:InlB B-repeat-containing protein [Clostridia bacterium]